MSTALATETRQPSHTERAKARLDQFMASLEQRNDQIATLLTDSGVDPAVFLAVSRRALTKTPDLLDCTPASLMQAFINAATDGLPPDGRKGAITYFKMKDGTKTAQWNPMVQGLLEIAYRSRQFLSIEAQVVYKGEPFEYQLGDDPFIRHRRTAEAVAGREIINAYAIARTTNGGVFREVMEKPDLDKIRNVSRAQNGPNKDWPEEMARKAPLRRLWKYLPKTPAMDRITDHDDQTYDLDAVKVDRPAPRLATGFAPKALTQDATPTVEPIRREPEVEYAEVTSEAADGRRIEEMAALRDHDTEHHEADAPRAGEGAADPGPPDNAPPPPPETKAALPAGMKRGSDLLKEQEVASEPLDPMEWKAVAWVQISDAADLETLDALFATWTEDGSLKRLQVASRTDWRDLCDHGNARKVELEAGARS